MRVFLILALAIVAANAYSYDRRMHEEEAMEVLLQEDIASLMARTHDDEEIIAQSICSAIAGSGQGWTYAVIRSCYSGSTQTCTTVCTDNSLHSQDPQTNGKTWTAIAAFHVYYNRPSTSAGKLGLKVLRYGDVNKTGCGPNYCCCYVPE